MDQKRHAEPACRYDPVSLHLLLSIPPSQPAYTEDSPSSSSVAIPLSSSVPIGLVRYTPHIGKISRLIVAQPQRGHGWSRVLMQGVEGLAGQLARGEIKQDAAYCPGQTVDFSEVAQRAIRTEEGRKTLRLALHSQASLDCGAVHTQVAVLNGSDVRDTVLPELRVPDAWRGVRRGRRQVVLTSHNEPPR